MVKAVKEKKASKASELASLSKEALLTKLAELTSNLDNFYKSPADRIEKPKQKGELKRERARILTLLQDKA
jgi:ribosomal protein L29